MHSAIWLLTLWLQAGPSPDDLSVRAAAALRGVTAQLSSQVARGGGYPARWSPGARGAEALSPAATAALGLALAQAYLATGDSTERDAALGAARALVQGQRESGGWGATLDLGADPVDYTRRAAARGEPARGRDNTSLLSADVTPAGVRLLLTVTALTRDAEVAAAADSAVWSLLRCPLAGGGWPASYPLTAPSGAVCYAGGQAVTPAVLDVLLDASERCPPARAAAVRAGDWLLRQRLPDGGWATAADQADRPLGTAADLGATAAVVKALVRLYRATGEERFRAALPAALARLEHSAEPAAAEARELGREVRDRGRRLPPEPSRDARARRSLARAPQVSALLAGLEANGCWLERGELVAAAVASNISFLATYLREFEPLPDWLSPTYEPRPPQHKL